MKPDQFYPRIFALSNMPANIRVKGMNRLHLECLNSYLAAIEAIDDTRADEVCPDGRTLAQIVAHISEWERYIIQSMGDVISGVRKPFFLTLKGYRDMAGERHDFNSIDDFNEFQAKRYLHTPWSVVKPLAIHTATALQGILSQPILLPFDLMEKTAPYDWHIPGGSIVSMPIAWYLWIVVLEHEVVDHARELGLE
ncbi:MAG: hypothetical protein C0391_08985 [Anaerolinea sp.]|nr:hypothetical protein [Anaerolinea sp.]